MTDSPSPASPLPATAFRTFWSAAVARVAQHLQTSGADPSRCVVLLPFAQLLPVARQQWAAAHAGVMPRFDTTQNWAQRLRPFVPGPQDMAFDPALDLLTAQHFIAQSGTPNPPPGLDARLQEAALQLAPLAAAQPPDQRSAWMAQAQHTLRPEPIAALHWEQLLHALALVWAGHSAYATDAVWHSVDNGEVDALVLVQGMHADPLAQALAQRLAQQREDAVCVIDWQEVLATSTPLPAAGWHLCLDPEDEAQRAAACVQQAVQTQQGLVALVDNNRALTRRIRALLAGQGLALRDETGWKLSTTLAASQVLALLRAAAQQASSDAVLAWLKLLPPVQDLPISAYVDAAEAHLRRREIAQWPGAAFWQSWQHPAADWLQQMDKLRISLQSARPLAQWLADLRLALQASGQWPWLEHDAAGQAVLAALHWLPGSTPPQAAGRWPLATFTRWASQVLEAAAFHPPYPLQEQVAIVPPSQLLARPFAAIVMPGCDEQNLPASPEPPGWWSPAQRELLGLPDRADLQQVQRRAWQFLLTFAQVDLLASRNDGQADLQPSPLVLEWQCAALAAATPLRLLHTAADPRLLRDVPVQLPAEPAPNAQSLPVHQLSASGYHQLRECPYRFFALHMLQLREVPELVAPLEKRDFGNWLHRTLFLFHEKLAAEDRAQTDAENLAAQLDDAAAQARQEQQLDDAAFLPFQCVWPQVRDGYLAWWQADRTETGSHYVQGEVPRSRDMGELLELGLSQTLEATLPNAVQLRGTIDRMDRIAAASHANEPADHAAPRLRLIDYKTEGADKTRKRISQADEDTQLAFYALLQAPEPVQTAYLSLGEKGDVKLAAQNEATQLAQQLLGHIVRDLSRIAAGKPLRALGEGSVCNYCAARGLCSRDFRHDGQAASGHEEAA